MKKNHSPWIQQTNTKREIYGVQGKKETDVAIVGGGIAGIATAYFTLKHTSHRVFLLEGSKIAHGATGHNGGFLASYFERAFFSLAQEFGIPQAVKAQNYIESAWDLLYEIKKEAEIKTPMWEFTGYAACSNFEEVLLHLRSTLVRKKAGIVYEQILVSATAKFLKEIPKQYKELYKIVSEEELLNLLETSDTKYMAALASRKGCMNSALFCEELALWMLNKYRSRFSIAEDAWVKRVVLKSNHAVLSISKQRQITAKNVVLCTNGFEKLKIINTQGPQIDKRFHQTVRGIVGYMAGYLENSEKTPAQVSYLPKSVSHDRDVFSEEPYFYITRRPYPDPDKHPNSNLICVGGPETLMDDTNNYVPEHGFPNKAKEEIQQFLATTYKHGPRENLKYDFLWHGLMGFTPNGVRMVGPDPVNKVLFYNLGCNGVGLLPSIFGGRRIARFLAGEKVEPSIFDPKNFPT